MADAWWLEQLARDLSQGDVLREVSFGTIPTPPQWLQGATLKGRREGYVRASNSNQDARGALCLARVHRFPALVVSASCDIDKNENKRRVLVAPVSRIAQAPPMSREVIMRGSR